MWVMISISQALHPHDIIAFELAGTLRESQIILAAWERNHAMNSLFFLLGFDYFFMVAYSFTLWFACMHIAAKSTGWFQRFLVILAWIQPLSGVLDAVENGALYHLATGSNDTSLPVIAKYAAIPKFAIVFSGLSFWIIATTVQKLRSRSREISNME
jgi:hypothetical protein